MIFVSAQSAMLFAKIFGCALLSGFFCNSKGLKLEIYPTFWWLTRKFSWSAFSWTFGVANSETSFHLALPESGFFCLEYLLNGVSGFLMSSNILSRFALFIFRGSMRPKIASGSIEVCWICAIFISISWLLAQRGTTWQFSVTSLSFRYLVPFSWLLSFSYAYTRSSSS